MRHVLLGTVFLFVVPGCSQSKFSSGNSSTSSTSQKSDNSKPTEQGTPTSEVTPEKTGESKAEGPLSRTEKFAIDKHKASADIVWVIDNSGSMANEVAQVRANFEGFIKSTEALSDARTILISRSQKLSPTFGVELSAEALTRGHSQLDIVVSSTNPMVIAAAGICAASQTAMTAPRKLCGVPITLGIEDPATVTAAAGKIMPLLRPEAVPVFVFVTDDNSTSLPGDAFLSMISGALNSKQPVVFSFSSLVEPAKSTCSVAAKGAAYQTAAAASKGKVFDICIPDWSSTFSDLTEEIKTVANSSFTLKGKPKKLEVYVDEVLLQPSQYQINGNVLTIGREVSLAASSNVRVEYEE